MGIEAFDFVAWVVIGCLLAAIGEGAVRAVGKSRIGWRGWYHRTLFAHPILAGAALGFAPSLPAPEGMGEGTLGRVLWFGLSGALSAAIYKGVRLFVEARVARAAAGQVPRGFIGAELLVVGAVAGALPLFAHSTIPMAAMIFAGGGALLLAGGVLAGIVWAVREIVRWVS